MSVEITTLSNGLRVVSETMPQLETVSLGVWVGSGARHERADEHGISHFLEHMAFKGTTRRSAQDIAEEIENVGGELNAATSLEMTAYYARILRPDVGCALEILADILQDSRFDVEEVEREQEVILQEIASTRDSPDDQAYDLMQDAAFPNQSLGRSILGTEESVRAIGPDELRSYLARHYAARRMVISAAGAIDHGDLVRHTQALFGGLNPVGAVDTTVARYVGGARGLSKAYEQSHLITAFEGPRHGTDEFFVAQVLSGLFGGGMSSRLFQEVREKRGLCYAIYSFVWGLTDVGLFGIHAATGVEQRAELMDVVTAELRRLAAERPSDSEVRRSKAQIKAGMLMGLESSGARAEQMARQLIAADRIVPVEELTHRIEAVSAEDIRNLVEKILSSSVTMSEVGDDARPGDWSALIHGHKAAA
jgi:predicted Zn-dependent peptidase